MAIETDQVAIRQIGRWMIVGSWMVLLLLLTLIFGNILDEQRNPNKDPESITDAHGAQVILKQNRAGHYVASGSINGHPVIFLLDTGATDVALSGRLAEKLGLKKGYSTMSRTANGQVVSWNTQLDEVALGSIILQGVRASILPSMMDNQVLLGMSFLKRLELIQRDGVLTLRQY